MSIILNLQSGVEAVSGALISSITSDAVSDAEVFWKPLLDMGNEDDAHWLWGELISHYGQGFKHYSVLADGACQGLMIVKERDWLRGRNGGEQCCYLERVSSAPWNRKWLRNKITCNRRRVVPVGSCLVAAAVQLSVDLGFEGRLAWHSLPRAVPDYERLFGDGLENLGVDYEHDLPWLEVGTEAAKAFLAKMKPNMGLVSCSKDEGDVPDCS